MTRRVRFHAELREDLRRQIDWLSDNRDPSWIDGLRKGIEEAEDLVSTFPHVGTIEAQTGTSVLRRLILRKVPYVLWFTWDTADEAGDVWFLRLFHAREERPSAKGALRRRKAGRAR